MRVGLGFRRRQRLAHAREFEAVFAARARKNDAELIVQARPNGLAEHRLGLGVGRHVGPAHRRVLLKRRLREAFRLLQHELPRPASGGYDIVINARRHPPRSLAEYQEKIRALLDGVHREWERRARRDADAS